MNTSGDYEAFTWRNVILILGLILAYRLFEWAYNVSPLHPLYRFPGPKLAAMTYAYEAYFDLFLWGKYSYEIKKMHHVYGPVVRINPHELHCIDAEFTDEIYAMGGRKRNRWIHQLRHLMIPGMQSTLATVDHDLHRQRRGPMQKFFSKAQISKLEPGIHELAQALCNKILAEAGSNEPIDISMAYSCFTTDIIAEYCFGESFGYIAQKGFQPNFRPSALAVVELIYPMRYLPWMINLMPYSSLFNNCLPQTIKILNQTINVTIPNRIEKARAEREAQVNRKRETIFDALLSSDLPPKEKATPRLTGEASLLLGAGTETVSWALTVITFHLLRDPVLLQRATEELQTVVHDPLSMPSWSTLEKLPYTRGVILEGLRLSYGVSARSSRVIIGEDLAYKDANSQYAYLIPRGSAIGMSCWIMHHNEEIFPDSDVFNPDRWLDEKGQSRKDLEKYLMSFSKGTRQCLGMK